MVTRRTLFKTIAALAATAFVPPAFWLAKKAKTAPKISRGWAATHKFVVSNVHDVPILTKDMLHRCIARFREMYAQTPDQILVSPRAYQDMLHHCGCDHGVCKGWGASRTGTPSKHYHHYSGGRVLVEAARHLDTHRCREFLLVRHPRTREWHPCFLDSLTELPVTTEVDREIMNMTRDAARKVAKAEINEFYKLKGAAYA